MFNGTYNGMKAMRFKSSLECRNMQETLKHAKISHTTKIIKHKKRGNEFIIMLVEAAYE